MSWSDQGYTKPLQEWHRLVVQRGRRLRRRRRTLLGGLVALTVAGGIVGPLAATNGGTLGDQDHQLQLVNPPGKPPPTATGQEQRGGGGRGPSSVTHPAGGTALAGVPGNQLSGTTSFAPTRGNRISTGATIVFSSDRTGRWQIFRVRAGGLVRRLSDGTANDRQPALSPNGQQVAFATGTTPAIWVMNIDGTHRRQLTFPPAGDCPAPPGYSSDCQDLNPRWSPDGTRIAFTRSGDADKLAPCQSQPGPAYYVMCPHIDVVDMRTGRVLDLGTGRDPDWSPDGRWLAFDDNYAAAATTCPECDEGELYVMRPDGSNRRSLGVPGGSPRWSPDGRLLAYWREHTTTQGGYQVVFDLAVTSIATATSHDVSFRGDSAFIAAPAWAPDGTRLMTDIVVNGHSAIGYVPLIPGGPTLINTRRGSGQDDTEPDLRMPA